MHCDRVGEVVRRIAVKAVGPRRVVVAANDFVPVIDAIRSRQGRPRNNERDKVAGNVGEADDYSIDRGGADEIAEVIFPVDDRLGAIRRVIERECSPVIEESFRARCATNNVQVVDSARERGGSPRRFTDSFEVTIGETFEP